MRYLLRAEEQEVGGKAEVIILESNRNKCCPRPCNHLRSRSDLRYNTGESFAAAGFPWELVLMTIA